MTTQDDPSAMDEPSKTERKREAARLRTLGKTLTELNSTQLASMPLTESLVKAIQDFRRFPTREAKRRQLQRIGKLIRNVDSASIQQALETLAGQSAAARYTLHQLEGWRDRLLAEPQALTEYLNEHPTANRQLLRQLLKKASTARDETDLRASSRALFRFLRGVDEED